jgi:thioester reductase-like protein
MTTLETQIASIAARCLRPPIPGVDPDMPFALLGLDSLGAIELAVELEQALGFDVHPDLLADCRDVRALAARLSQGPVGPSPNEEIDRMLEDAVLPDDVQPTNRAATEARGGLEEARAILLTGATGFLGASLAEALLERSSAAIVCLVRPGGDARARLDGCLKAYGVRATAFDPRIKIVEGDLRQPRLGLSEGRFAELASDVDAICHAGAMVNWISSYTALRAANVTGTLELLRLACLRTAISFHFVSSLSVCYSSSAPDVVDESFDPLPHLRSVHLGYAQSKIVAEALVHEAGARGLPVSVYRPAIISGNSRSGAFNQDDVLAALIKGCVRMGTAPDLDWQLDCEPVDVVAAEIVRLSAQRGRTFHLSHERPRHWRECVLWMRLYGYPVRLVSYHTWLRQLERDIAAADHPLRPLRSFFLDRPAGAGGLTLPELYEEGRRTSACAVRTRHAVKATGVVCPPLDASLLDRYFAAYVDSGYLPAPPSPRLRGAALSHDQGEIAIPAILERALGDRVRIRSIEAAGAGSDHSIISELAAWRTGRPSGLFRYRLELETDGSVETREVVVKIKPSDRQVIEVGEAVARICNDAAGDAYAHWGHRIGFAAGHTRELAIYAQDDARFTRHAPSVVGSLIDDNTEHWVLVLERVTDGVLMDSVERPRDWSPAHVTCAVRGLAALQAIWIGREAELRRVPWIGHVQSADSMAEMSDLWRALADHAAPAFSSWADPAIASIQRRLIDDVDRWWTDMETGPRTLIHNDFNPRNICLRPAGPTLRLCAYDWELATVGAPQRDLAELLCFVLPDDVRAGEIDAVIEQHRGALMRTAGIAIDADAWQRGFRAAVYDLLINRLPMYALVHRIRRQSFLPRVVRTWRRLYEHVGFAGFRLQTSGFGPAGGENRGSLHPVSMSSTPEARSLKSEVCRSPKAEA